jgi:Ca2+-binding EF-hand superfamily protein
MEEEMSLQASLFRLLDQSNTLHVSLSQIRYALDRHDVFLFCFDHVNDFEALFYPVLIETIIKDWPVYHLSRTDFLEFLSVLGDEYRKLNTAFLERLYDAVAVSVNPNTSPTDGVLGWDAFTNLINKNKAIKKLIQSKENLAFRFLGQIRFYKHIWKSETVSKSQFVNFVVSQLGAQMRDLRIEILTNVHEKMSLSTKQFAWPVAVKSDLLRSLIRDRPITKLLQKAPNMQIFSLPRLYTDYFQYFPTKSSGVMELSEFLHCVDRIEVSRFDRLELRKLFDEFQVNKFDCIARSELTRCINKMDLPRHEKHRAILNDHGGYPVLFRKALVLGAARGFSTKRMGEVSFEECFQLIERSQISSADRSSIRHCFDTLLEIGGASNVDNGVKKQVILDVFHDEDQVREIFIEELTGRAKHFEFVLHLNIFEDELKSLHTTKYGVLTFEEFYQFLFTCREWFPFRRVIFSLYANILDHDHPEGGIPGTELRAALSDSTNARTMGFIDQNRHLLGSLLDDNLWIQMDIFTTTEIVHFQAFFERVRDIILLRNEKSLLYNVFEMIVQLAQTGSIESERAETKVEPPDDETATMMVSVENIERALENSKFNERAAACVQGTDTRNVFDPPEIILEEFSAVSTNRFNFEDFFQVCHLALVNFREHLVLHSVYVEAQEKSMKELGKAVVSKGMLMKSLRATKLTAQLDTLEVLTTPSLYEEAFLEGDDNAELPVTYKKFFDLSCTVQDSFRDRKILRVLFDMIDEDGSETIDKREVLRAFLRNNQVRDLLLKLESLQVLQQPTLFEDAFVAMDTSGDGEVSFEEFVQFAVQQEKNFEDEMALDLSINISGVSGEEGKMDHLKKLNSQIEVLRKKVEAKQIAMQDAKEHYEEVQHLFDMMAHDLSMKEHEFESLRGPVAGAAFGASGTPRDMWDVLRQQKGDDGDMVREKMYEGPYGIDEKNESTTAIYEELHQMEALFEEMWERTTGEKPKDPYEFMIQILRRQQASRRVKLGIDLKLRDVNEPLPLSIRTRLWEACRDDKPEPLQALYESEMISQNHRSFYVDMHNLRPGDELPGYGYELEPSYHLGYDSTCLHVAAWFGSDKVVTFLLGHFADPFVFDIEKRQAKDVAKTDHSKLLLHKGAQRDIWREYHNPMVPKQRSAHETKWGRFRQNKGSIWKRKFDDRDPIYQEDRVKAPDGIGIDQYNSIKWTAKK